MTLVIVALATGIGVVFPDIISGFSFIGGTGAVCIVILFPLSIYVKMSKKRWY